MGTDGGERGSEVGEARPLTLDDLRSRKPAYLDMLAYLGMAKHLGAHVATEWLVERCRIGLGSRVLDVGCGPGFTSCWLARNVGCRVVGADLMGAMVASARERARRMGVERLAEFRVADAQALPFCDGAFDAALCESVLIFVPDRPRAVSELARVVRPGGCVGINEEVCTVTPPPPEYVEYNRRVMGVDASAATAAEWRRLLEGAGLEGVEERVSSYHVREEATRARVMGVGTYLRVTGRLMRLMLSCPAYRGFAQGVLKNPRALLKYMGYALFAGRKPGGSGSGEPDDGGERRGREGG